MTQSTHDQWHDCPAGTVAGLVQRLRSRRRRERLRRVSVGVAGLAILLMAGVYAVPHFRLADPSYGGVRCSEVKSLADEYIASRLDGGMMARIQTHLEACPRCQQFVESLRSPQTAGVLQRPVRNDDPLLLLMARRDR